MFSDKTLKEVKELAEAKEKQNQYDDLYRMIAPVIVEFKKALFKMELLPDLKLLKSLDVHFEFDDKGLIEEHAVQLEIKDNQ